MKENFEIALAHVLREEGGVANHPQDPGGLTKYGITLPTLSAYRNADVKRADLLALTRGEAATIYRTLYWDGIDGDHLPPGVDLLLFDFAVNSGPTRAIKTLQSSLHEKADGVLGPKTKLALTQVSHQTLIRNLADARLGFLKSLSVWPFFGRGWKARVARTHDAALKLIVSDASPVTSSRTLPMPNVFENTKTVLQSRTVWANVIGLASLGLSIFGYGGLDVGGLTDAVLQTVTAGSFIASTIFRVKANAKLS